MSLPNMTLASVPETLASGLDELADAATIAVREILEECSPGDPMVPRLEMVRRTLDRLVTVSGHLNAMARRRGTPTTTLDLNLVIRELTPSLRRLLGPFITLEVVLPMTAIWAASDRGQLEKILLGLVINARESLPLGGDVRVAATAWNLTEPFVGQAGTLAPGDWSVLEVRTRGAGIAGHVLHRLLEPEVQGVSFDSTLSLPTISAVVREGGGDVVLRTEPDGGVLLAACFPAAQPLRLRLPATGVANAILVVDDDEWARLSTVRTLRRAGFGVLEAGHADDAIELLDDVAGSSVRMVVADSAMLDCQSGALNTLIVRERPDIELLILTRPDAPPSAAAGRNVLAKPFAAAQLLDIVRGRLGADLLRALP